ncbi:MAG: hypothetical protein B5M51_06480 [Anaerolinea sp. 4484_236]|nr:MAG: hypothetical protein B5M51_06480 [Anaerolinea sp. 4484_236]RLD11660.1 MAG: hypothetical protein DRI56_00655 [Chloroflexota bacterium]
MNGYNQGMKKLTFTKTVFGLGFAILLVLGVVWQGPVQAAPQYQLTPFPTPTPGTDGRIIYIIKQGDTLWRIAAITGISVADLRALNNLGADEVVVPGQELFLGLAGPAEVVEPTVVFAITATPAMPTETPEPGFGTLCVLVFEDENGDSIRQEEEHSLPGGAINISNRDGSVSITEDTVEGDDYFCTENLEEGSYNASAAIPEGYNPTMVLNTAVELAAGDISYLTFGAQANSETVEENLPITEDVGKSPLLGLMGVVLLLGGVGLGVYAVWFRKR